MRLLRRGEVPAREEELSDAAIDVLQAACRVIADGAGESHEGLLQDAAALYSLILQAKWPEPDFDERAELLSVCAVGAWRAARRRGDASAAAEWAQRSRTSRTAFVTSGSELEPIRPAGAASEFHSTQESLIETEAMLAACERLREQQDGLPAVVRQEAEFFYRFLREPKLAGLVNERQYFLGEFALIAGTCCRQLSCRDEARVWFDRAEAAYEGTLSSTADLARLAYQRLALRMEERQVEEVMALVPALIERFENLGMLEDAVKCRVLQGLALLISSRFVEAVEVFSEICHKAETLGNRKLVSAGLVNLTHCYALLGEFSKAFESSEKAIPLLRAENDKIGLAKVEWGLGTLLRGQGQIPAAIEMYRASQKELESIGVRGDVAMLRLVVADLLLERGQGQEAMREILAALPVIDELKMVPEGMAALSLLRDSLRHQKINQQALSDLHRYFEETRK